MTGLKIHITILLIGIFVFPLFYQPYHVIKHHAPKSHCTQACCHSKVVLPVEKEVCNFGIRVNVTVEKEKPCPICEYHFPINILPKLVVFKPKTAVKACLLFGIEERLAKQQIVFKKSPRAPPAHVMA
ncbi:hypothetical protein [uncultured Draconibacterium sp.]|uniref:hypothetical protein n=1 Tax=uncultured Draconibacterium sp. TaxID=1573823 RepID=UPI0032603C78